MFQPFTQGTNPLGCSIGGKYRSIYPWKGKRYWTGCWGASSLMRMHSPKFKKTIMNEKPTQQAGCLLPYGHGSPPHPKAFPHSLPFLYSKNGTPGQTAPRSRNHTPRQRKLAAFPQQEPPSRVPLAERAEQCNHSLGNNSPARGIPAPATASSR